MEYLITAYPSTPTPAMILTPPARAYSPSPSPAPEPVASTSKLPRRVLDHILLPRLPAGWLGAPPTEPVPDDKACHQCRNAKNPHPRFRCGRPDCLRVFCTSCLVRRYAWTAAEIHERGCPGCRGVCNCSRCLDRAGLSDHKAFLTADARAGGCARTWLAARGLLVEGGGPPPPPTTTKKKNMARRPRILSKKLPDDAPKKVKKTRPVHYDDDEDEPRSRGRWIIDASEKLVRRWARERAARADQVRAGTRRWFVGASPPPRGPRRRVEDAPPVETIDLTLDDDDEDDAPDSLFDGDGDADGPVPKEDGNDDDAPDSLFDERTDGEDAPAPDDKSDADSLFDGEPGTPSASTTPSQVQLAPAPVQLAPAPVQLAPTPVQLPPTPVQLPPTPIHLPPTPIHLPPTPVHLPPTPVQLPPGGSTPDTLSLSRSDSYTDALRIDVELAAVSAPGSPAKPVSVPVVFGDPFNAARSPGTVGPARSPVTTGRPPASPVTDLAALPAPPPKSPPKSFAKAASAMFIPRAKRKREDDGADETRLDEAKSSAGVLVALGRPGRAKRLREEEQQEDALATSLTDGTPTKKDDAPVMVQKDDAPVRHDDALARHDDTPMQQDDAALRNDGAPAHKRAREDTALDDARPAKRAALSKETARKPPERADDYGVDDEPSKETARKHRADANIVDALPTPRPTVTKQDAARPSAADALAQAMRAAYGGGASASTSDARSSASTSGPGVATGSARAAAKKGSKPTVLAQRAAAQASGSSSSLAIALKAPAPSAAAALAAAYKQAYAASPASTLRSSPTPEPPSTLEQDGDGKTSISPTTTKPPPGAGASKPALHDELSTFIDRFDDEDKDEPTPELLPSDLAAQSEGSSRTGPVSPAVAHRRPPIITINDDNTDEEEMPQRRPFVPCNPRRFVGMPLRFVPAPKRPRPRQAVIDVDSDDDGEDEQDFGLARRRKRTKLWEQSAVVLPSHEPIVVLDDSDDSDFQPPVVKGKAKSIGPGKGKAKSFGPGKGKATSFGPGKGKTKPPPRKLPLSSFIAYSYTPPPNLEQETMPEPVFVPDDDTAAAPPASEVWLGAAMAPLSPDLGLTRAVADAWFSAV